MNGSELEMDITKDRNGQPLFDEAEAERIRQAAYLAACMMRRLRRECPWDQQQTPASLKRFLLEETYEVLEAIESEDWTALRDELGDYTLQALFHAEIQQQAGRYGLAEVFEDLVAKMVRRHPHVYSDTRADRAEDVAQNWEQVKRAEKGIETSIYDSLTTGLPALMESYKISSKAAKVGFDWPQTQQVLDKVDEELGEVRDALAKQDVDHLAEELGDLLFAVSNLVRKAGFEPEEILRAANRKFVKRFRAMEHLASSEQRAFESLSLAEQEELWEAVKISESQKNS